MNYLSDPADEFLRLFHTWCENNPLDLTEYSNKKITSWNKGIPHTEETKKLISERKKGSSCGRGLKKPHARENLKYIKHRAFGKYEIINPEGISITVINLKKFCSDNNLNYTSMSSLATGKWPCESYRGYRCTKLGYVKIHR